MGASGMEISTIGIDLAKEVFQIHAVDARGNVVLKKKLKRKEMATFFANLTPCLIGMEACSSSHYWARKLQAIGHQVKLMAPQFVKPYVKANKNDAADAEAICEAVTRPSMRFVGVKNVEQQTVLATHRVRSLLVAERTALVNQTRGLLGEFGLIAPKGVHALRAQLPDILEDAENELTPDMRELIAMMSDRINLVTEKLNELELKVKESNKRNDVISKLQRIPGIGPLTASAMIATIGNFKEFKNGRELAAFLGVVPRQHSSGGKQNLLGISKRGDGYLRTLLIHGARSVIRYAESKQDKNPWLMNLIGRRNKNIAAVALANKNIRIIWAMMTKGTDFNPRHISTAPISL
jgi:transposase